MDKTWRVRLGASALLLALVVGFGVGFYTDDAYALPANEVDIFYYSDATYTTNVGERDLLCSGHLYKWGTTSDYSITTTLSCW